MKNNVLQYIALVLLALLTLAGCGQSSVSAPAPGESPVVPQFAVSEAVVGRNRIALGLIRDNTPVNDPGAKVHLRFYDLSDTSATVKAEADAIYYGAGLPAAVWVAYPEFDKPGEWAMEVQSQLSGQSQPSTSKLRFVVQEQSQVPNVGDKAVSVKTPTVADTADLSRISSGNDLDPALYQVSLDQALASGKPTALLFATPAYCQTATCGPSLQVMQDLQETYGDRMNFIHVEVYRYPFEQSVQGLTESLARARQERRSVTAEEVSAAFSDPMRAWGLTTEPWLYLIDGQGTIAARYEGGITREELAPVLDQLVSS